MAEYILCDTCVLIDYINSRDSTIDDFLNNGSILFINSIIEMEILQGARNKQELQVIKKKLLSFRLLNLQQDIFLTKQHNMSVITVYHII